MSMMETEKQGIVVLHEDAEEGKPCEFIQECSHEAVYKVTFVLPDNHECGSWPACLLCLVHTDEGRKLVAAKELHCTVCKMPVLEMEAKPIRRS